MRILPQLRRNGFKGDFHGISPVRLFKALLSDPRIETLMKGGEIEVMKHFLFNTRTADECWASYLIAKRHKYQIDNLSMWCDYLRMLKKLGQDLRNPKNICPEDFMAAHDNATRKIEAIHEKERAAEQRRWEIERREREQQRQLQRKKDAEDFIANKSKFFGLVITDEEIIVKVLESIDEYYNEGKAAGIAGDLRRMLDEDFHYRLAMRLYSGSIRQAGTEEKVAVQNKVERPAIKLETVSSAQTVETPTEKPQPADEKPEIEPRPQYSAGVQLTLLDLWGMTEEVSQQKTAKKKNTAKKGNPARRTPSKPKTEAVPKVTAVPTATTPKTVTENKEAKTENTAKPADPDDIYATLDWDTNPPINGFYEMMMGLTPERRKELRELARQHNEKQVAEKTEVKAVPETSREQPRQEETQPEAVAAPAVTDTPSEAVGTFLFPDIEAEKPKEEVVDLSPRAYHRTPEMHLREGSLVADRGRHNIGYLKDITPYGATFQPLDLKGYQKEKALLYVSLRDAYERLYRYESLRREANVPWREHLNTCYDEFVMRYGNLNAKQNVKLVMMDAGGRDILSLERMENGKFVKADIFEHPVSFAVESHANVGSPEEALSASLNKYGTVNLDYMREITDSTAEDLLTALQGRIYYNPLVTGYEIKDRFIAGNVIEKAERIEAWMGDNPENERMPEVKQALEALKDAEPQRIAFEDLDFNFGERWIPTGVYAAYMSRLFDTEVKIAYSASMDEFSVACGYRTMKITDEFLVKGYYRNYDGMHWQRHQDARQRGNTTRQRQD